jgi:hypothetical protein
MHKALGLLSSTQKEKKVKAKLCRMAEIQKNKRLMFFSGKKHCSKDHKAIIVETCVPWLRICCLKDFLKNYL